MNRGALAEVVAANPGPAAHLALLGTLVVIGLVVLAVTSWRRRREAQADHDHGHHHDDHDHHHDRDHREDS